jgi:VRR-NUC domain
MTEAQLQRLIFAHVRARGAPRTFLFHPMNGGIHQIGRRAGINSAMGVIPGVPDLIGVREGRFYALELKIENGRLSDAQQDALIRLRDAGATATHAHGLDQALQILERWQLLRGRAQ